MENDDAKHQFSRRGFLGIGSAALAAAAGSMAVSGAMVQESKRPAGRSATDPGPINAPLDAQILAQWASPYGQDCISV